MRSLVAALALALVAATLTACQDEPAPTDAEEFASVNDSGGPVLEFPDGSTLDAEVRAFFPGSGFDDCEVELLADAFEFDLAHDPDDSRLVIYAVGHDDDLDALKSCAGLIDPDD
jgi:hypothetical protein